MSNGSAIRFANEGTFIPNVELKFIKTDVDADTLHNSIILQLNKNALHISPIELQIAYKLFLGSAKDIEDARFLYGLFADKLDKKELKEWLSKIPYPYC